MSKLSENTPLCSGGPEGPGPLDPGPLDDEGGPLEYTWGPPFFNSSYSGSGR